MNVNALIALRSLVSGLALCAAVWGPAPARAQSEASLALSLLPLASVASVAGGASTAAGAVVALPAALALSGAVLTIQAVSVGVSGTVYLLERASDGAQVSLELAGRGAAGAGWALGRSVQCSVVATGVLLSAAGELLAFVPNALGRALLHDERVL